MPDPARADLRFPCPPGCKPVRIEMRGEWTPERGMWALEALGTATVDCYGIGEWIISPHVLRLPDRWFIVGMYQA